MATNYRLIETYPENGERYGKPVVRNIIYNGPDRAALKQAIETWCAVQFDESNAGRRPYADYTIYLGKKVIYPYEL